MSYQEDRMKYENFVAGLFPAVIMKNRLVATIIYHFMRGIGALKIKVDKRTNRDI